MARSVHAQEQRRPLPLYGYVARLDRLQLQHTCNQRVQSLSQSTANAENVKNTVSLFSLTVKRLHVTSWHCPVRRYLQVHRPSVVIWVAQTRKERKWGHMVDVPIIPHITALPESVSTCVKVHLSDLVLKRQKRVWVGQVHRQRKGEQSHNNKM